MCFIFPSAIRFAKQRAIRYDFTDIAGEEKEYSDDILHDPRESQEISW